MCKQLGISRARYYKWLHRDIPVQEQENQKLAELIKEYDEWFRHIFGYCRMASWIKPRGMWCGWEVSIQANFSVSPKWLKVMMGVKQKEKIGKEYFDTELLEMKKTERYIEGYKAGLVKDRSFKGLRKVSFTLREF